MFENLEYTDFMRKFYNETENFVLKVNELLYELKSIKSYTFMLFSESEKIGYVILNKLLSQYMISYFYLCDERLYVPAFNEVRTAIEVLRLLRLYTQDKKFRDEYLKNDNFDFRKTSDYAYTQSKVNKRLDELEKERRSSKLFTGTPVLRNHSFTKGSAYSEIHSELSKWSHALNVNLIFPIFVNENKIKLGIYNDETVYSDIFLKKYTELICLLCMEQYDLLDMYLKTGNHEVKECYLQMLKNYDEYIKKFY